MSENQDEGFSNDDMMVSTGWLADHLGDPDLRIVESDDDPLLYAAGHIAGAVQIDWTRDPDDPARRDYLDKAGLEKLMSRSGIANATTVILYGDMNNYWASYGCWVLKLYGHKQVKILDGGRDRWVREGRDLTRDVPDYPPAAYIAPARDEAKIRAHLAPYAK